MAFDKSGDSWWAGYNDAACGNTFDDDYKLRTSVWQYRKGWLAGGGRRSAIPGEMVGPVHYRIACDVATDEGPLTDVERDEIERLIANALWLRTPRLSNTKVILQEV